MKHIFFLLATICALNAAGSLEPRRTAVVRPAPPVVETTWDDVQVPLAQAFDNASETNAALASRFRDSPSFHYYLIGRASAYKQAAQLVRNLNP